MLPVGHKRQITVGPGREWFIMLFIWQGSQMMVVWFPRKCFACFFSAFWCCVLSLSGPKTKKDNFYTHCPGSATMDHKGSILGTWCTPGASDECGHEYDWWFFFFFSLPAKVQPYNGDLLPFRGCENTIMRTPLGDCGWWKYFRFLFNGLDG